MQNRKDKKIDNYLTKIKNSGNKKKQFYETVALQEQGIEPARARKDNETMHWEEREQACLADLCKERGVEIEILGEDCDDYSIPEYKKAMRDKETAEAEIEILMSEKIEAEALILSAEEQESCREYESKLG